MSKIKEIKGFVVPLITIVVMFMALLFCIVALLFVSTGHAKLEQDVETYVQKPALVEIAFNAILEQENNYPADNNKMRNLLSMYNNTHDGNPGSGIHQEIDNIVSAFSPNGEFKLTISGVSFDTGVSGSSAASATRRVAIPEGNSQGILLRYYG